VLSVKNLQRPGLAPCSFTVPTGTCTALTGPSGSGKTLLLRALIDLDENTGCVAVDDQERATYAAPDWRRCVGYLPAEPGWWADKISDHFVDVKAAEPILNSIGLKPDILDQYVETASTGERQRLALVRLLAMEPRVLLLDEPTAALDDATVETVERLLTDQLSKGTSILLVSHDQDQANRLCRQWLTIKNGQVREKKIP